MRSRSPQKVTWLAAALGCLVPASAHALDTDERPARGRVVYQTGKRAYLNHGRDAGIEVGQDVTLKRGRTVVTCNVQTVGDHFSVCELSKPILGGSFDVVLPVEEPPRVRENALTKREAGEALTKLSTARLEKVDYDAPDEDRFTAAKAIVQFDSYRVDASGSSHHAASVHVVAKDVRITNGLRGSLDVSGYQWFRPDDARFRTNTNSQLYVWEANLSAREDNIPIRVTGGRFQPWNTPGLLLLDGVQLGLGNIGVLDEIGVFGGGIPDHINIDSSLERWTVGLYYNLQTRGALSIGHNARVAVIADPEYNTHIEVHPRVWMRHRTFSTQLEARLSYDVEDGEMYLGSTHASLYIPIGKKLQIAAAGRYVSGRTLARDDLGPIQFSAPASLDTDLSVLYSITPRLQARLIGRAAATNPGADPLRILIGPEVGLRQFPGPTSDLWVGYREEVGWWTGRSAYAQVLSNPRSWLTLHTRLAYYVDATDAISVNDPNRELGLSFSTLFRFNSHFLLRVSALSRYGLNTNLGFGGGGDRAGVRGTVALEGSL